MNLDLNSWEARIVLEALATLDQKWTSCKSVSKPLPSQSSAQPSKTFHVSRLA
jgi:hypothetical protein